MSPRSHFALRERQWAPGWEQGGSQAGVSSVSSNDGSRSACCSRSLTRSVSSSPCGSDPVLDIVLGEIRLAILLNGNVDGQCVPERELSSVRARWEPPVRDS